MLKTKTYRVVERMGTGIDGKGIYNHNPRTNAYSGPSRKDAFANLRRLREGLGRKYGRKFRIELEIRTVETSVVCDEDEDLTNF